MLVYLYGLDSYRRHNKLKEIIAGYKKKHSGLSLERFYLEEDGSFERLKNFAVSQSLFDHSKLGIVNDLSSDTKEAPKFLKSLVEIRNLTLIIVSDKALGKDFRFLLEKPSLSQSFEKLEGAHLATFIKKEAEVRGVKKNSSGRTTRVCRRSASILAVADGHQRQPACPKKNIRADAVIRS